MMRHVFTVLVSCIGLLVCAMQPASSQSAAPVIAEATTGNQSDAAEKHAKRTACLKDAKLKKLVGPQKTAFMKDCMAADAPGPLTSASSTAPG